MGTRPSTTLWRIADDRLEGRLAERLAELRADDRSWRWISRRLAVEVGFSLSHETLRAWGEMLEIPEPAGPESVAS